MPGLVVLGLLIAIGVVLLLAVSRLKHQAALLDKLAKDVNVLPPEGVADGAHERIGSDLRERARGTASESLCEAWDEFGETLIVDERNASRVLRNTVRSSAFFNVEDLGYGPGSFRIAPGLFVSIGLALTFLGLIAALHQMADRQITAETMQDLLKIASAKFIMSLAGLFCSILFTLVLRRYMGRVEKALHRLVRGLEKQLSFASLEQIAMDQLKVQQAAEEVNRKIAFDMVAELSRPLREELPVTISSSIASAMQPMFDKMSSQGMSSMSSKATELTQQVSGSVGRALTVASERIAQAGDRIGQLADRMDQSSGRMGSQMDQAVLGMTQAVDDLRGAARCGRRR